MWPLCLAATSDAEDFLFHPTQTIEDQPNEELVVRFRAVGLLEMAWHLNQCGDAVEVLEPEERHSIDERSTSRGRRRPGHMSGSDRLIWHNDGDIIREWHRT